VALFNKGESVNEVTVLLRELGVADGVRVRDLWAKQDLGTARTSFTAKVPRHGVVLVKMR
jgi:alpha-galactosidase